MPRKTANPVAHNAAAKAQRGARVRTHLRLMLDEEIALGPGKIDLLEAIRTTGSISAAGKEMGMSYRRAWLLVDTMNRCFRKPLVTTATGGSAGGGTVLTAEGEAILQDYRAAEEAVRAVADEYFARMKSHLRAAPQSPAAERD